VSLSERLKHASATDAMPVDASGIQWRVAVEAEPELLEGEVVHLATAAARLGDQSLGPDDPLGALKRRVSDALFRRLGPRLGRRRRAAIGRSP
jgi:hypothetical protein